MKKTLICDVCGGGELQPITERYLANYKGRSDAVLRHSHVCTNCGGDYATESDARENKREIVRLHKTVDSIPFGCEIRAMREASGLTQLEAGQIFGGGPTAFSKYETDDLVPTDSMVNLLKLAILDVRIVARLRMLKGVHVTLGVNGEISAQSSDYGSETSWERSDDFVGSEVIASGALLVRSGFFDAEQKWTQ